MRDAVLTGLFRGGGKKSRSSRMTVRSDASAWREHRQQLDPALAAFGAISRLAQSRGEAAGPSRPRTLFDPSGLATGRHPQLAGQHRHSMPARLTAPADAP